MLTKELKILLVEDEPIPATVHQLMLKTLGYEQIDLASTGQQALKLALNPYHCIFMDIGLGDMDGFLVTQKIREIEADQQRKATYIIGLTAYVLAEVQEKSLAAGMDVVLSKPITADKLKDLLKNITV